MPVTLHAVKLSPNHYYFLVITYYKVNVRLREIKLDGITARLGFSKMSPLVNKTERESDYIGHPSCLQLLHVVRHDIC